MIHILQGDNDLSSVLDNGEWNLYDIEATSFGNLLKVEKYSIYFLPEGIDMALFIKTDIQYPLSGVINYIMQTAVLYGYMVKSIVPKEFIENGTLSLNIVLINKKGNEVQFNEQIDV